MVEVQRSYRGVSADERRQQRRRLLIEACLDLVGSGGTLTVTAESVSARAKLTKRYFYESFTGRDAVLVAALDEMFAELLADIRTATASTETNRAEVIAEAFVSAMCEDPRRARLYAEAPALPALLLRREEAIVAFTDLLAADGQRSNKVQAAKRQLMTRIIVSGVTDVVTSWLNGTLSADRKALTQAIVALGSAIGP